MTLKVNLGSGSSKADGWTSVDKYNPLADIKADLLERLPFDDDSVDEVMMTHVIEHIPYREHEKLFTEIYRILKPNGKFGISCPDFIKCAQAFIDNYAGARWSWWVQTLYGSQEGAGQFHVAPITLPHITEQLVDVGFNIDQAESNDRWDIEVHCRKGKPRSYFM